MKILYVTDGIAPYVVGGMQAVSRRQIVGLAAGGIDVAYVHSFRGKATQSSDLPGEEHVLDYPFSRGLRRWAPWHYPNELKAYSEKVDEIVQRVCQDVVYTEGPLTSRTLLCRDHPPVVFHPHGLNMYQDQMGLLWNLRARTLRPLFGFHARNADRVISQGGCLTEILTDTIGVSADRVAFLPNAVPDLAEYEPKRKSGSTLKCLFVGRDDPKKGFGLLRQAIASLPGVTLEVVGMKGTDSEQIRWHGVVRDADQVREFYRGADVLVLPSYSEGMATVLLEAMQAGTPAIATDVGATREVVVDGGTGWLIQPGSASAVTVAIRKAAGLNDEVYQRYSQNCLRHVEDNFQEEKVCQRLIEILGEVASN